MMYVIKRSGDRQEVVFDKIKKRIDGLARGLDKVDTSLVTKRVIDGLFDNIKTIQLDELTAQVCASMAANHIEYSKLAARVAISNLHKQTEPSFSKLIKDLHAYIQPETGKHAPYVSDKLLSIVMKQGDRIDAKLNHDRDYETLDYFAIKTLTRSHLFQLGDKIVERPQHLLMRVALCIHEDDLEGAFESYNHMSQKYFTHATPTMFNAGTPRPQLSSCFLMSVGEDSIEGIYKSLVDCAKISQYAGGIGLSIHNVRAKGSFIVGSRGYSSGIVPMLRNYNETARYVDQGGGKRKGSIAIYLEPWHADIFSFLDLRKNHGSEELRTRDLFTALWVPDLFMKRVEEDAHWSLFCPNEAQGLSEVYGKEFEDMYTRYEEEGRAREKIKARDLWFKIIDSQIETGTPYMLYKDASNFKSNQNNLGTIKLSNLCAEILEYTSKDEIAVCNLASIALNRFVKEDGTYDFKKLHKVTKVVTRNLDLVIDRNYYVLPECETSNFKHRPIGIGTQGLADAFALMKLSFDEPTARKLNKDIFETIYHGAIEASIELAREKGKYKSFEGSPSSKGFFQFDLWGIKPESGHWDWEQTRKDMVKYGLRNSLLLAQMPTATTAQILGNNESTEPFTSNLYVRRVLSGEFIVVNKHLLRDLSELGLWNSDMKNKFMAERGSIQKIDEIPEDIKLRYRTVRELPQKSIIDMAADRGAFICQSQSLNINMVDASAPKITALHFHAWNRGLKTGMYYLRNTPSRGAVQFTVEKKEVGEAPPEVKAERPQKYPTAVTNNEATDDDDPNLCFSCGS